MTKGYAPQIGADIHLETSGRLPVERLDTSSTWDGVLPPPGEPAVIVFNSAEDDAPHWRALADMVSGLDPNVGGDLDGTLPNPSVVAIQGEPVAATAPDDGDVLTYDATAGEWAPAPPAASGGGSILVTVTGDAVTTPGGGLIVVGVS